MRSFLKKIRGQGWHREAVLYDRSVLTPNCGTHCEQSPVTLTLTSRCLSLDTGREDRLVTTPLLTVLGTTADSLLVLRWRAGVTFCFLTSLGVCRKSWTNSSQSNMRNTRRLLRTTVKQEESFVDLQERKKTEKKRITKRNTVFQSLPRPYSGPVSSNSVLLFSFLLFLGYPYAIQDGLRCLNSVILLLRHGCTWECRCAAPCQAPLQYFITATFEHGNIRSIALGAHQV